MPLIDDECRVQKGRDQCMYSKHTCNYICPFFFFISHPLTPSNNPHPHASWENEKMLHESIHLTWNRFYSSNSSFATYFLARLFNKCDVSAIVHEMVRFCQEHFCKVLLKQKEAWLLFWSQDWALEFPFCFWLAWKAPVFVMMSVLWDFCPDRTFTADWVLNTLGISLCLMGKLCVLQFPSVRS